MPELPEVETVKRTLQHLIVGKTIRNIDVFYEKMIRGVTISNFSSRLIDQTIEKVNRYGKYLIFHIGDQRLISHLRMEGKYFIKEIDEPKDKHDHVIFYFTDGTTLRYNDVRKFGTFDLVNKGEEFTLSPIKKLGFEPFNKNMTGTYLKQLLQNKSIAIKSALLDQHIIVGLGNIYVDEVLFLSKIHPTRKANSLTNKQYDLLVENSEIVLKKAIHLGGTTIRSYTSSLGVTGRFQNELLVHMRKDETCYECGNIIIKTKVNGRGTYLCEQCQK